MDHSHSPAVRHAWAAIAALTALAAVLRGAQLTRFSFWADECLTMFVAGMPVREIVRLILVTDVHPPLFYLLLHVWQSIGKDEVFLRSFSLVPGVLTVPAVFVLARGVLPLRVAVIAAALIAVSPLHVVQSQQLRYPALVTLLSVLALHAFRRTLETARARHAWVFVAAALSILFMNYVALGVVAFALAWLVAMRREQFPGRRLAARAWLAVAGVFALWVPILVLQSQRIPGGAFYPPGRIALYTLLDFTYGIGFWGMPRAGSRDAELAVLGLAGKPWILAATLVPFLVLFLAGLAGKRDGRRLTFERLYLAVVLGFGWGVCARANVFQAKYVLPALPAFAMVIAAGIDRLVARWRTVAAVLVAAVYVPMTAYGLSTFYTKKMTYEERYRELARFLRAEKRPGDAVLLFHNIARACTEYYVGEELGDVYVAPRNADNDQMDNERFLVLMREIEARYDRLWVIFYYEGHRDPGRFARSWLPVQFRPAGAPVPAGLADVVSLYEVRRLPSGEVAPGPPS